MENLETYNRVKSLQSTRFNNGLLACNILLMFIALAGVISFWLMGKPWLYSAGTLAAAVFIYLILSLLERHRPLSCQYCGHSLHVVIRPFLLTSKYLAMRGHKQGDYFYTRCSWGKTPWLKRWAKISNRSLACHHCRLTEEKQTEYYETVSAAELAILQANN